LRLAQAELMELRGSGRGVQAFRLVRHDSDSLAELAQRLRDEVIGGREPLACVGEKQHAVGFLDGAQRLLRHQDLYATRVDNETAGIDDEIRNVADFAVTVFTIARQPGQVRDERVAGAGEEVEQGRLADVRPADQRDDRQHLWHPTKSRACPFGL
jgi:hypothetical protein